MLIPSSTRLLLLWRTTTTAFRSPKAQTKMASKYYFWKILKGIVLHKVGWVSLAYDILKDLIKYIISIENYRPY
jgi:hypothetical protein